jgi:hypothetical protein
MSVENFAKISLLLLFEAEAVENFGRGRFFEFLLLSSDRFFLRQSLSSTRPNLITRGGRALPGVVMVLIIVFLMGFGAITSIFDRCRLLCCCRLFLLFSFSLEF